MDRTLTGVQPGASPAVPQPPAPEATCSVRLSERDETRVEFLTANHERGALDCGKAPRNAFIRQHAAVNMARERSDGEAFLAGLKEFHRRLCL